MPSDHIPSNNPSNNKPSDRKVPHLLTASDIANLPEVTKLHFLNANFTAPSLPHGMRNPFAEDLVYLMGGERLDFDISEYPKKQKRNFRSHQQRQIVDFDNITNV
ncbi:MULTISPECIES: hypothetical protein [Pseudanabaena]|uniref:Uncharacterized protein n=2 Tax=Pseudanabaena TaxID=1152 RepID=L8N1F5_9CYAN|nr:MULTISPECIES: hypothetical protein [Pseudanabaena]ELS34037.1 hypothetical protein Pse7429DRAFT_0842 [Pseudanabaena biceps PCC 7429]MDG3493765.1 hypothetical protein [Pseudanabaena catenata USMAC16]